MPFSVMEDDVRSPVSASKAVLARPGGEFSGAENAAVVLPGNQVFRLDYAAARGEEIVPVTFLGKDGIVGVGVCGDGGTCLAALSLLAALGRIGRLRKCNDTQGKDCKSDKGFADFHR